MSSISPSRVDRTVPNLETSENHHGRSPYNMFEISDMLLRFETIAFQRPNVALFDIPLPRHVLNFRYVEPFRNESALTGVENRSQIWHFLTLLYKSGESDGRNVCVNVSCDT